MGSRVLAVVLLLGLGLGVWLYGNQIDANEPPPIDKVAVVDDGAPSVQPSQAPPFEFPSSMAGDAPDEDPVFNVDIELRMKGGQPNLHFTVTEQHGWAADMVYINFWHRTQDEDGEWKQTGGSLVHMCKSYLDFNGVLSDWTTPMSIEFPQVEDWGTSDNWEGRVAKWNRLLAPTS